MTASRRVVNDTHWGVSPLKHCCLAARRADPRGCPNSTQGRCLPRRDGATREAGEHLQLLQVTVQVMLLVGAFYLAVQDVILHVNVNTLWDNTSP